MTKDNDLGDLTDIGLEKIDVERDDIEERISKWMDQLEGLYNDEGRSEAWSSEKETLPAYLAHLFVDLYDRYEMVEPINMGGTAIIFEIKQKNTQQELALKFNRPLGDEADLTMVANESETLPKINHANIIRAIDRGDIDSVDPNLDYLIEPKIDNPKTIDDKIDEIVEEIQRAKSGEDDNQVERAIESSLQKLVPLFRQWATAINHLHENGYIHLDIKPENVLVDETGHLEIIDLGSVKEYNPDKNQPIAVFFTRRYAHPTLKEDYDRATSSNRLKKSTKRSDLTYDYDYYALGTSILELLNKIASAAEHDVPQIPIFRSLHLLATRLLTAQNTRENPAFADTADEIYGNLMIEDYDTLRYDDLSDVIRDLEKEEGLWNPEQEIPELASYSKKTMRLTPQLDVALTPRLLMILEHPLFARLRMVSQLGLIRQIYPSADHSRYDHALGTYHRTTEYIKALFNDFHNPLFRNLVDADDLKTLLLASLLHDIGHYPLAHDLEEVNSEIFSHAEVTRELLEDSTTDEESRTLKDLIENEAYGWGVDIENLKRVLGAQPDESSFGRETELRDFKIDLLAAIIDGPIDADKADYIHRDTLMCGLPYGEQLDLDRLLGVITVARLDESMSARRPRVTVGVYEKGISAAKAFGQARTQLYSSVYWHHTSRIMKSMVQYALAICLYDDDYELIENEKRTRIKRQHFEFAKKLNPTNNVEEIISENLNYNFDQEVEGMMEETADAAIEEVEDHSVSGDDPTITRGTWHPGTAWTDYIMLHWLKNLPGIDDRATDLLDRLATRRLYKRVIKLPFEEDPESTTYRIRQLDWGERLELCEMVQEDIKEALISGEADEMFGNVGTTTTSGAKKEDIIDILDSELAILIDAPDPGDVGFDWTRPLVKVPQLRSKTYYQDSDDPQIEEDWVETLSSMMKSAAPVRVICHPELRQVISSSFYPARENLEKAIIHNIEQVE